jgi:hypothetical protein
LILQETGGIIRIDKDLKEVMEALWIRFYWQPNDKFHPNPGMG